MSFTKAVRTQSKARVVIVGPSKSGKSMTALRIARGLVGPDGRIAARDSEAGSLAKYAVLEGAAETEFAFHFDTDTPSSHSPTDYVRAIREAEAAGYDAIILDSLSHAWTGRGGALEIVDSSQGSNKFTSGWSKATPLHNDMIEAMTGSSIHIIATLRTKTEYVLEQQGGKTVPKKVGTTPVQRDGMEYEFDLTCTMDREHRLTVDGTRCQELEDMTIACPTQEVGEILAKWLGQGVEAKPAPPEQTDDEKQATVDASEKDLANAIVDTVNGLMDKAVENEISGAPQSYDAMEVALKTALVKQMGAPNPKTATVGKWLGMLSWSGLEDDGRVVFAVPEDAR